MNIQANPFAAENTLANLQEANLVNCLPAYSDVAIFLEAPFGLGAENRYERAVAAINKYEKVAQERVGNNVIVRNLGTLTDGTVWVDTSKSNNTYQNFLDKKINENHNSRPSILEAVYEGSGFEIRQSSTTRRNQARRALRIGSSRTYPLGVVATSFEENA
jgi:hypothetical protein